MSSGYVHVGDCVYLPGRRWALRMMPSPRDDSVYGRLLDHQHRRSGWIVYKPVCMGCRECRPIRVPVAGFKPSKSQRRCLRRNQDVTVEVGPPDPTEEKLELHNRFVADRFERSDTGFTSLEAYSEVFGSSPITTLEMRYRIGERLVGLGIVDVVPGVVSSVYFFFDPAEGRRSLGTFSALREIEYARNTGRGYLYLGYYVTGCKEMSYKARFRPCELLSAEGEWRPFEELVEPKRAPESVRRA